jgi:hypothetical protein
VADDQKLPGMDWQVPPAAMDEDRILGWCNEATEQGQAWLKSQRGYPELRKALDILSGKDISPLTPSYRSRINTNRLKRNTREICGTLAKLRPFWGYHTDNNTYKSQAEMMNKVTRAWYLSTFADRKVRDALAYTAATGRGWLWPRYQRAMGGTGHGDITIETFGAPCVLPVQLPANGNWQSSYANVILDEMPVWMAHAMFPAYQSRLLPKSSKYWYMSDGVRQSAHGNVIQRIFGKGPRPASDTTLTDLFVPIRYAFINDLAINTTDRMIPMGEPGSSWFYEVPALGATLPDGSGKANENDARLYPYRRLIISTDTVRLYDGPGFDWHGMFPLVSFCLDDWPWEPIGFSLVHDGAALQDAINEVYRGNMDKVRQELHPSLVYDMNAVTAKEARAFDPFQPNARASYDGSATDNPPFHTAVDANTLKISAESMAFVERLEGVMDEQQAIRDITALAKMRAVGSMDELEKIMEANGPIVEDMSRSMEPPMRDLGVMVKYLVLQYYNIPRLMQIVGANGIAQEIFDYDPASIVPSHLPGEDVEKASPTAKLRRARVFADNLQFFILPNSLHEMTQMVMKLGLIQLKKAGVKIDSQTIAEAWQVANYGTIEGSTVMEKFQTEQRMDLEQMAAMKQVADEVGLTPPGGPPGAAGPGKPNPEGRPPSGNAAPALKSKDNGTRSTITESK